MKKQEIKLGEFIVTREEGTKGLDYIKIAASSGFWNVRIREDNEMFEKIRLIVQSEDLKDYAETVIKMMFLMCSMTPDTEFMVGFFKLYSEMSERMLGRVKEISKEEDDKILDVERKKQIALEIDSKED